jgi:DnaK suppressor protein
MTSQTSTSSLSAVQLDELFRVLADIRRHNVEDRERAQDALQRLQDDGGMGQPAMTSEVTNAQYRMRDAVSIIGQVDAAERRIDAGTYGVCAVCEQPIPFGRLVLRPYGVACAQCSE